MRDAQAALLQGKFPLAAVLLRGAWEVSHDVKALDQLARAQAMGGQFDEAAETYARILTLKPPPELAARARAEMERLKAAPAPFSDEIFARVRATNHGEEAFKKGLALARRKQLEQAVRYLRAALVLDPMLPGTYRVLGGVYGKLKDPKKEREFLQDYLRIRPDGKIAEQVRARLKPTKVLANLRLEASYPCAIWVNGRPLGLTTPVKDLLLPGGTYTVSFVNAEYHIIRNKRVKVAPAGDATVRFEFGVLTVDLDPWARARANGKDLGLWTTIGLPVGTYSLALVAHDMSRKKEVEVTVHPGKITRIDRW